MASELYVETLKGLTSGANANKVIVPAGQTLDASAGSMVLPAGVGGKVLQVVEASTYTKVDTATSTQIETGVSATITPSSTSSKIVIFAFTTVSTSNVNTYVSFHFYRDSTDLGYLADLVGYNGTANYVGQNVHFCQVDSPNTTSATTYKLMFGNEGNVGTASAQGDAGSATERGRGQIILMEIAG